MQPTRSTEFESLFPDVEGVAVFFCTRLIDDAWLSEAETEFIQNAVPGRRAEFATGRACARAAIEAVGVEVGSLPVGTGRQPVWPSGITAAITHTRRAGREFIAAVAAPDSDGQLGIGIDAEVIQPLKDGVRDMLLVDSEQIAVDELDQKSRDEGAIRIFSAKEAFYKAQFALTQGWVGFGDMFVDGIGDSGSLVETGALDVLAEVRLPAPYNQTVWDGLVISGVTVRRF